MSRVTLPHVVGDIIDFVYPGRCAACGEPCPGASILCHRCDAAMDNLAAAAACQRCGAPVVSQGAPCPWCRGNGVYPFEKILRLARFDEPLREVIHAMKYRHRWPLAQHLADRLLTSPQARQLLSNADVLVPVPLHWARQIGRGFNQADLLANALARRCDLKVLRPVRRIRHTLSQTAIFSRTMREENVHGAFAAKRRQSLLGRRVVVVDDVMTTAATMQAVGRVLQKLEPASLSGLVLAVADPRRRDHQGI
jgi:ComF family protein